VIDATERDYLRARALRMRGDKSMGLIARELGVSRNVIAGLFFREDHPGQRMTGSGHRGNSTPAKQVISRGGKRGRRAPRTTRAALGAIAALCKDGSAQDLRQSILEIAERAIAHTDKARDRMRTRSEEGPQA